MTATVIGLLAVLVAAATGEISGISTLSGESDILIKPNGKVNIEGTTENTMRLNRSTALNSRIELTLNDDGATFFNMYADDQNRITLAIQNETDSLLPNSAYIYISGGTDYFGITNADTNDFLYATTVSNIPYIGVLGGTDLYFRQYDDSAWITVHADAFTEHTNPYNGTVLDAYLDIADWLELKHPERMSRKFKRYEQRINPITNESYDGELSEEITTGTDLGKAGKANALINIHQKKEIEKLKTRLDEIEQTLCQQGLNKYC